MMKTSFPEVVSKLTLVAVLFGASPLDACADEPMPRGHFTLTGVDVVPIERSVVDGKVNDHRSETLTYWIRFDVRAKFKLVDNTKTKPFKITNPTDMSKCSLTVDKPISFKGKEVPAGTNLMKHQKFDGRFYNVSMPRLSPFAAGSIHIRDDFQFPPDTYTLRFQWETSEGKTVGDTVTVRIDVGSTKEGRGEAHPAKPE